MPLKATKTPAELEEPMPTMFFFNLCYKTKKDFRNLGNTGLWWKVPSWSWVITQGFGFSLSFPYDSPPQQNLNIFRPLSSLKKSQPSRTCSIPYGPSATTLSDSLLEMRSLQIILISLMMSSVSTERSCGHPVRNVDTTPRRNYPSAAAPLPNPWQPCICCLWIYLLTLNPWNILEASSQQEVTFSFWYSLLRTPGFRSTSLSLLPKPPCKAILHSL